MIKNDTEYQISREQVTELSASLKSLELEKSMETDKKLIFLESISGEIHNLKTQISNYELLKSGKINTESIQDFTHLPMLLIKHRIASGLTEEMLAKKIGTTVNNIMEMEDNLYFEADPNLILKASDVLKLELPESLTKLLSPQKSNILQELKRRLPFYSKIEPNEIKEGINISGGILKLYTCLNRLVRTTDVKGVFNKDFSLNFPAAVTARYKSPKNADQEKVTSITSYAHHLSQVILQATPTSSEVLETDPIIFKKKVIGRYNVFSFESVVKYLWDLGIPVIPLKIRGGFHGACWRINGRNAIVLKQTSDSFSRWLFDLLHEYRHATQEQDLLEKSVVDLGELLNSKESDPQEIDANNFAIDVLFDKKASYLKDKAISLAKNKVNYLKSAVVSVAEEEKIDCAAFANFMAFHVSEKGWNWWGAANNLQTKGDPYSLAREIMQSKVDIYEIEDKLDREMIRNFLNDHKSE